MRPTRIYGKVPKALEGIVQLLPSEERRALTEIVADIIDAWDEIADRLLKVLKESYVNPLLDRAYLHGLTIKAIEVKSKDGDSYFPYFYVLDWRTHEWKAVLKKQEDILLLQFMRPEEARAMKALVTLRNHALWFKRAVKKWAELMGLPIEEGG